jgi:hypothetical protein
MNAGFSRSNIFYASKAAGWKWKARSDAGARTCNGQPEPQLNIDLLLTAPHFIFAFGIIID